MIITTPTACRVLSRNMLCKFFLSPPDGELDLLSGSIWFCSTEGWGPKINMKREKW